MRDTSNPDDSRQGYRPKFRVFTEKAWSVARGCPASAPARRGCRSRLAQPGLTPRARPDVQPRIRAAHHVGRVSPHRHAGPGPEVALIGPLAALQAHHATAGDLSGDFCVSYLLQRGKNSAEMSPRSTRWWPYPTGCARSLRRWSARGESRGRRVRGGKMSSLPGTSSKAHSRGQGTPPCMTGRNVR